MPDDVGGRPFQDGWEPDDDRGGASEDFASVVFDEDFVRAAEIHEPTAVERLLAAAEARADAESGSAGSGGGAVDDDPYGDGYGPDGLYGRRRQPAGDFDPYGADEDDDGPYGRHGGALRPYRSTARWHRPIAWLLALLMGIGMVALAFSAVYRSASGNRQEQAPSPVSSGADKTGTGAPGADEPGADEAGLPASPGNEERADETRADETRADETHGDESGTGVAGLGEAGVDRPGVSPSASADYSRPAVSAVTRTP